ncbi:MAG: DNA repair protein RadC [Gammaproteobacteria bacterium]
MPIRDWPAGERPREKLISRGAAALSDTELVALLISSGAGGHSAVDLARDGLQRHGSLRALLRASPADLIAQPGVGPAMAARILSAPELTRRALRESVVRLGTLTSSSNTRAFLHAQLRDREHEVFCCVYLDNRNRVIEFVEVFRGTIDGASVYPREIVKQALSYNAAHVIFAHNHPSGVAEPSAADERITRRLQRALALVDIRVLDHIVVGDAGCVSLAERGLL